MRDQTHHLLRLQALLESMQHLVAQLADDAPPSEVERSIIAHAAEVTAKHGPRTRADVLRFSQAIKAGDEGWLVIRSVPGEHRTDAIYLTKLPPQVRKTLGI